MSEQIGVRVDADHYDALAEMQEEGFAANDSEALRISSRRGLEALGYRNGRQKQTALRRTIRRAGDGFALTAVFLLGLTLFLPLGIRLYVLPVLCMAITMYATDRLLAHYEPRVSRGLASVFGGEVA